MNGDDAYGVVNESRWQCTNGESFSVELVGNTAAYVITVTRNQWDQLVVDN